MELKKLGSYLDSDVIFLLKDLSDLDIEKDCETREKLQNTGVHYSEMLPIEYTPSKEYMKLFYYFLDNYGKYFAKYLGVMAERVLAEKGEDIVIVSLARAGTPIGVLMKRYLRELRKIDVPHYSISIIRGKGLDFNAIKYIVENHPNSKLQFLDGWTGKGAITTELKKSVGILGEKYGIHVDGDLAVVADPGYCAEIYGTRDDLLIPSSCLNSNVSGLMSRTVLNASWIGENEFHGAKYYKELEDVDVSLEFVDTIEKYFEDLRDEILEEANLEYDKDLIWKGLDFIKGVMEEYGISDVNKVKPGIGETTRVLLRRIPWKILIRDKNDKQVRHLLMLAKDRRVEVEVKEDMLYSACGIIR